MTTSPGQQPHETRFTTSRQEEAIAFERQAAAARNRVETIIIGGLFVVTTTVAFVWTAIEADKEFLGPSPGEAMGQLAIILGLETVCLVLAVIIAVATWMGEVGTIGQTILRSLALVTTLHVIAMVLGGPGLWALIVIFAFGTAGATWLYDIEIVEGALIIGIAIVLTILGAVGLSIMGVMES